MIVIICEACDGRPNRILLSSIVHSIMSMLTRDARPSCINRINHCCHLNISVHIWGNGFANISFIFGQSYSDISKADLGAAPFKSSPYLAYPFNIEKGDKTDPAALMHASIVVVDDFGEVTAWIVAEDLPAIIFGGLCSVGSFI